LCFSYLFIIKDWSEYMAWIYILLGAILISGLIILPKHLYDLFLILLLTVAILITLAEPREEK
jgi:hypothetical protein